MLYWSFLVRHIINCVILLEIVVSIIQAKDLINLYRLPLAANDRVRTYHKGG